MTNTEFSNEFDVLYNNITSNQAPGLDEYEKSVFLTKAQDEVIKSYFSPELNKSQRGFDGSERRQIDFSMILTTKQYEDTIYLNIGTDLKSPEDLVLNWEDFPGEITVSAVTASFVLFSYNSDTKTFNIYPSTQGAYKNNTSTDPTDVAKYLARYKSHLSSQIKYTTEDPDDNSQLITVPVKDTSIYKGFSPAVFDLRDNSKSIPLEEDILMIINESAEVERGNTKVRLVVIPIQYLEYSRLMSKPYKRPLKNIAWRIFENSNNKRVAELIVGPNDRLIKYVLRYVRRPRPIIIGPLEDDLSINGEKYDENKSCELDPILHKEILQRAVELAKSAYMGDLTSQLVLGQQSQTNMGVVAQSNGK